MTRLTAGTHVPGRLAAASIGLAVTVATGLLAGCGVGQIAATAKVVASVPGGSASTPVPPNPQLHGDVGGTIFVQNVTVDYAGTAGYPIGGNAPLALRIINESNATVTLKSVISDAGTVVLTSGPGKLAPATSPSVPASSPSPHSSKKSASPSSSATPSSPSSSPSAETPAPSPSPASSPSPSPGSDVTLRPQTLVVLAVGAEQYLEITNLTKALPPGLTVSLTLTFTDTANLPIAPVFVMAPVAPPLAPASRSPIDLGTTGD